MKGPVSKWLPVNPVRTDVLFMMDVIQSFCEILSSEISNCLQTNLSKPGEGIWHRALHRKGEADVMSHHHLVYGFHLEPVAVVTDGSVDALKVPTLKETIKT